ncbi:MAG: DNA-directed RNA polymerase subunit beta', partial [Clostridiales bacterium]|nr:DNA-directed RNA polymerase subunit beta' [Clostridiales bacterium]
MKEHPVLLNCAPTLHRLGIQAFEPVLVEGRAIQLHPLMRTTFKTDFGGDQVAVHIPLSVEAQAEARILMLSANNLLRPQDGRPTMVPDQDMILGCYYLTILRENEPGAGKAFSSPNEALMAYQSGDVGIHAPIRVRVSKEIDGKLQNKVVETTVGRIIFNEPIPQDLGFVDRTNPETMFNYEVNFRAGKKQLEDIIRRAIAKHGFTRTAELLDNIKALGFKYSTKGAITISIHDMPMPEKKQELIREVEQRVIESEKYYKKGFISNDDLYRFVVQQWDKTTKEITEDIRKNLDEFNPIYMMVDSGAQVNMNRICQLAGMRGLMANTSGKTIEIPIKANFREGLSVLEYFTSSRGARKGLADTALRTADSGYLTRRLVDVSQDVIIRELDCGTHDGLLVRDGGDEDHPFGEAIHGRFPASDVVDPQTGEVLFDRDHMLVASDADILRAHGITSLRIRTVLECEAASGVCARCYGINLATGQPVNIGEAVGVIAAQSIGEPGTQLTMRTFHTGGVAGDDITQGLPRVEELFEARKPKKMAILSEIAGVVAVEETRKNALVSITVTNPDDGEVRVYQAPTSAVRVETGQHVQKGDMLTEGALNPHDVLRILGKEEAQNYIIREVQKVYRQQGVEINDKHIEVIVRQMMRKVRVEDAGSTNLLPGTTVDILEFKRANAEIQKRIDAGETDLRKATAQQMLMGITKASLATESFLSAASFQETTKVLTEAAIKGKIDRLVGLKENVIIGKLIPAGSGLARYRLFDEDYAGRPAPQPPEEEEVDLSVLKNAGNAL